MRTVVLLLGVVLTSCAALRGRDAVVVVDYTECALRCAIEAAEKEGGQEVLVQKLQAMAKEQARSAREGKRSCR
jgi:hypothetical protein